MAMGPVVVTDAVLAADGPGLNEIAGVTDDTDDAATTVLGGTTVVAISVGEVEVPVVVAAAPLGVVQVVIVIAYPEKEIFCIPIISDVSGA